MSGYYLQHYVNSICTGESNARLVFTTSRHQYLYRRVKCQISIYNIPSPVFVQESQMQSWYLQHDVTSICTGESNARLLFTTLRH